MSAAQTKPGNARAMPVQSGASSPLAILKTPPTARTQPATANNQYQRIIEYPNVAGSEAATSTASPTLGFASVPSWIVAGMSVYDVTTGAAVGTVLSAASTTVTLTANAANAVASGNTR